MIQVTSLLYIANILTAFGTTHLHLIKLYKTLKHTLTYVHISKHLILIAYNR